MEVSWVNFIFYLEAGGDFFYLLVFCEHTYLRVAVYFYYRFVNYLIVPYSPDFLHYAKNLIMDSSIVEDWDLQRFCILVKEKICTLYRGKCQLF